MVLAYAQGAKDLRTGATTSQEGGVVYAVDKWTQFRRFLILGSSGGTFYVGEQQLTKDNADIVLACIELDPLRAINLIVDVSVKGIAPKNDPAIFALAIAASSTSDEARKLALQRHVVMAVCRTGTHIMHFADYVNQMRGWGRGLKRAMAEWYDRQSLNDLAYQLVKYRQRDGWTHKDLMLLAHVAEETKLSKGRVKKHYVYPTTNDDARTALYRWVIEGDVGVLPNTVLGYEAVKAITDAANASELISSFRLPREALPTALHDNPMVQAALLEHMGMTAMIRNLGNMSKSGLLVQGADATKFVVDKLRDEALLKKSRVHPMAVLLALKTYQGGKGYRSGNAWTSVPQIVDALDDAFYASFANVTPTGKRIVLGIDISGSMQGGTVANSNLTCAEAAVAMAMVTARTEPDYAIIGYTANPVELTISPRQRLDDVMKSIAWPSQGTHCSVPAAWAYANFPNADAILNYTDNDTHDQNAYPALLGYRSKYGKDTIGVVTALTSHGYSIYPENDAHVMNVSGFDAGAPAVIADFIAGA